MKNPKTTSRTRIVRALIARFLCIAHIGFSIFVLYQVKKNLLFLIPISGAVLILFESILVVSCYKGKEPIAWFSPCFFIYVATIVTCILFIELENLNRNVNEELQKSPNENQSDRTSDIINNIRVSWANLQAQIFFALLLFIRWLIPKSHLTPHGLADILFKYFAISCDMLDFLSILRDPVLSEKTDLVYATLAVWSWSTFQFFIYIPKLDDPEKRKFDGYITNSLLSVLFLDLPFLGTRLAAIFAFGAHGYDSYFFATKNVIMILLQIVRVRATFAERHIRRNQQAKTLKDKVGFDKERDRLYNREVDEVPIKNFKERLQQRNGSSENSSTRTAIYNEQKLLSNNNRKRDQNSPPNKAITDI